MPKFRQIIFWLHLSLGIAVGIAAAMMSGTGVIMAFADTYLDLREFRLRSVDKSIHKQVKTLVELTELANASHPEAHLERIGFDADAKHAYEFYYDTKTLIYVDPYSGDTRPSDVVPLRRKLHKDVEQWHRFLGLSDGQKKIGKFVTSWSNVVSMPLLLTGIVLWWPRNFQWREMRAKLVGGRNIRIHRGWHTWMGLWVSPFLLIMALTATTHSFAWVKDLAYKIGGPRSTEAGGHDSLWARGLPARPIPSNTTRLNPEELRDIVRIEIPGWTRMDIHMPPFVKGKTELKTTSLVIRAPGWGPSFFPVVIQVDSYSGEIVDTHSWKNLSRGTQWLAWSRWLHKGEAFGRVGQIIAGLACLAVLTLIYTGWTLAARRLLRRDRIQKFR